MRTATRGAALMSVAERPSLEGVIDVPATRIGARDVFDIAAQVVAQRAAWEPHVRHHPELRQYVSLHESEHLGIWLICWMPGQDTGWHDHAGSNGAFVVAEGTLREDRPVWGAHPRRIDNDTGEGQYFDHSEIHRVACVGDEPAVSVHAYSAPLTRMGMYRIEPDGYVRRSDVSWEERLTC